MGGTITPLEAPCQYFVLVLWVRNVRIIEQHMEFLFLAI
jgi:hypothetical protein